MFIVSFRRLRFNFSMLNAPLTVILYRDQMQYKRHRSLTNGKSTQYFRIIEIHRITVVYLTLPTHKPITYSMAHLYHAQDLLFILLEHEDFHLSSSPCCSIVITIELKCTTPFNLPRQGDRRQVINESAFSLHIYLQYILQEFLMSAMTVGSLGWIILLI